MDLFDYLKLKANDLQNNIVKSINASEQYYEQSGNSILSSIFNTGSSGEYETYKRIAKFSDFNHCIANCYIPKNDGTYTEVDAILIHTTGIYVFESKNYSGYIFGSENNRNWTVSLYAGHNNVEKYHFYNPILQNKAHINYLKKYIMQDIPVYSYIVFSNRCSFKNLNYNNENVCICHRNQLSDILSYDTSHRMPILDTQHMQDIFLKLDSLSHKTTLEKQNHIHAVETKKLQAKNNHLCPLCGGKLILRTAKKGPNPGNTFYGCSNYPNCKFTQNL